MPRTRSILIDNSIGRVFTNVDKVSNASARNLIAGPIMSNKKLSSKSSTTVVPVMNLGGTGVSLGSAGGVIANVSVSVAKYATGATLTVTLKVGSNYYLATTAASISILPFATGGSHTSGITVDPGQIVYVDVGYSGTPFIRATGLNISINYYANAT